MNLEGDMSIIIQAYNKGLNDGVEKFLNKILDVCCNKSVHCEDRCPFSGDVCQVLDIANKISGGK